MNLLSKILRDVASDITILGSILIPKTLIDVASDIAILGGILTSMGFAFWACVVWSISNPYLVYYNYRTRQMAQFRLFLVMTVVSLLGVWNLWPR